MAPAKDKKKVRRPQAEKRVLQDQRRAAQNKAFKSRVKTAVKKLKEAIKAGQPEQAKEHLGEVYSLADKGLKRGVFKANKAARIKSRLSVELTKVAS